MYEYNLATIVQMQRKRPFHICGDFLGRLIEYGLIFSKRLNSFLFRSLFPFLFMSSHTLSRYHPDYTFCIVNSYSFLFLLSFSYNRPRSRRVPMESLGYRKTKVNGLTRFIFLLRIRSHIFHSVFAGYCSTNGTFLLRKLCVSRPDRPNVSQSLESCRSTVAFVRQRGATRVMSIAMNFELYFIYSGGRTRR